VRPGTGAGGGLESRGSPAAGGLWDSGRQYGHGRTGRVAEEACGAGRLVAKRNRKEIAEHHKKAEKQEEGSATEAKGRDRVITIIEAVLLAVVAVLAAYSGFAAAKWGTESSLQLAKASAARTETNRAAYQAAELRNFDSVTFNAWFTAYVARNKNAMRVAEYGSGRTSWSRSTHG
jgi:hypothetical protein